MAITSAPELPPYLPPAPTQEDLDYTELNIVDLDKVSTPEGRAEMAALARDAMRSVGFFYIINHGLSRKQSDRIFQIADVPFSRVSEEDKVKYEGKMAETGSDQGYKRRRFWHLDGGVQDEVENYNINRDVTRREHPEALRPFLSEISSFAQHCHTVVLKILTLLAIGLELPEDAFHSVHNFDAFGEAMIRFMKYYPRPEEDEMKAKQVWLKGHTDFGTISLLWSQPIAGLQALSPDGQWKWIRYLQDSLVINAGDCMEFLSGGYYKATIHRVIQPPTDQRSFTRLGVFYFSIPDDPTPLAAIEGSPVLEREEKRKFFDDGKIPTAAEWRIARTKTYGVAALKKADGNVEQEVINGLVVKHWN